MVFYCQQQYLLWTAHLHSWFVPSLKATIFAFVIKSVSETPRYFVVTITVFDVEVEYQSIYNNNFKYLQLIIHNLELGLEVIQKR